MCCTPFIHVQDILISFCNILYIISNMLDIMFYYIYVLALSVTCRVIKFSLETGTAVLAFNNICRGCWPGCLCDKILYDGALHLCIFSVETASFSAFWHLEFCKIYPPDRWPSWWIWALATSTYKEQVIWVHVNTEKELCKSITLK
jgi:hypothetical protein